MRVFFMVFLTLLSIYGQEYYRSRIKITIKFLTSVPTPIPIQRDNTKDNTVNYRLNIISIGFIVYIFEKTDFVHINL